MTAAPTPTDHAPTVGELLEEARKRRGLSKTRVIRIIDTTDPTYRSWTSGQSTPGLDWVEPIAEFCDVSRYVVLAAMGILTPTEARILDEEMGHAIPGYRISPRDNVVPLVRLAS